MMATEPSPEGRYAELEVQRDLFEEFVHDVTQVRRPVEQADEIDEWLGYQRDDLDALRTVVGDSEVEFEARLAERQADETGATTEVDAALGLVNCAHATPGVTTMELADLELPELRGWWYQSLPLSRQQEIAEEMVDVTEDGTSGVGLVVPDDDSSAVIIIVADLGGGAQMILDNGFGPSDGFQSVPMGANEVRRSDAAGVVAFTLDDQLVGLVGEGEVPMDTLLGLAAFILVAHADE